MMRAPLALATALVVALTLALPVVAADHLIHHRLYVVGRALDASGLPAPGYAVRLDFDGVQVGAACFDEADEVTGPMGDIDLCRHAHEITEGASVRVTIADTSVTLPVDALKREAIAYVRLAGNAPGRDLQGDRDFNRTFRVVGGAYNLHGTPVFTEEELADLTARAGDNATVRLVSGNATLAERTVVLDDRGRYEVDLEVRDVPEGARVRVEVSGKQEGTEADATFRRADLTVLRDLRAPTLPTARPGEEVPFPLWSVAAALLIVAAARRRG